MQSTTAATGRRVVPSAFERTLPTGRTTESHISAKRWLALWAPQGALQPGADATRLLHSAATDRRACARPLTGGHVRTSDSAAGSSSKVRCIRWKMSRAAPVTAPSPAHQEVAADCLRRGRSFGGVAQPHELLGSWRPRELPTLAIGPTHTREPSHSTGSGLCLNDPRRPRRCASGRSRASTAAPR